MMTNVNPNCNWFNHLRQMAIRKFEKNGFPSTQMEEWRYTHLAMLQRKNFSLATYQSLNNDLALFKPFQLQNCYHFVLVDGFFRSEYSYLPQNIATGSISQQLEINSDWLSNYIGQAVVKENNGFIDFNTGYFTDGFFLHLTESAKLDKPIQIIHLTTQEAIANTRHCIVLEKNSTADIIETFFHFDHQAYLTVSVLEGFIADQAQLNVYKLQNESNKAFHFGGAYIQQNAQAKFIHHNFALGSLLARSEIHSDLATAAECELNGLYVAKQKQHLDTHTRIHHQQPQAMSREFYKGILMDRGRAVFQGRVIVAENAQKTDSEMNNRNLLLSSEAEIDTKPQLEIYADDVKCSHGTTIGQLEESALFYLQSRGIDLATARNILTFAFANQMNEKIEIPALKQQLQALLWQCLPTFLS